MWTCWLLTAAILPILAEGAVRLPLRIGRRNNTISNLVLSADAAQKLDGVLGGGSDKPWPQSLYTSREIFANASKWRDIKMALVNGYDIIYFIDAQVGTPAQQERMIVDTGSSDMWLVNTSYGASASSTSALFDDYPSVTIRYGMGAISGTEVADRVCFAGLCVNNQSFVLDMKDSMHIRRITDGLLGLAYPELAVGRGTTLLQNVADSGPFKDFAFALALRHMDDAENSSIVIGELRDVLAEAPSAEGVSVPLLGFMNAITREPLPPMFWAVAARVSIGPGPPVLLPGVLDSGTSLIAVPGKEYPHLLNALISDEYRKDCLSFPGQLVLCPCGIPVQPMNFAFKGMNGSLMDISLDSEDLLLPTPGLLVAPSPNGPVLMKVCRLGVMAGPPDLNFWILGDIFLRKVYAVHDVFGRRVVLFPQQREFGGEALSSVGSTGMLDDDHMGRQVTALVLLLLTAMAFTLSCAAYSRFHGQAKASEVDGYHHF